MKNSWYKIYLTCSTLTLLSHQAYSQTKSLTSTPSPLLNKSKVHTPSPNTPTPLWNQPKVQAQNQNAAPSQTTEAFPSNDSTLQTTNEAQSSSASDQNPTQENQNATPKETGLFGPVRIGPMVGFGVLMGPNVGIEAKIFKYLGLSFSYAQYTNLSLFNVYDFRDEINTSQNYNIDYIKLNYQQIEGKISYFPWGKTFFIGSAFGKRTMVLNAVGRVNAIISQAPAGINAPIAIRYAINSTYLTPQIGWLATWDGRYGGFAIGTEFGAQFSLSTSTSLEASITGVDSTYINAILNSSQYTDMKGQIENESAAKIRQYPLPYWNIIKVGWLF